MIRPVYKDASGTIIPMAKTVNIKPRFDSMSDEYIILWNDVKMPLQILAYPGTVLDVVIEAPEIERGIKSLRVSKPTTLTSTSASPTIPRNDFAPSQNTRTTRNTESSPIAATNNPIQQGLRAPQDRGKPLEINCSVVPESIGRAPQLVPDPNSGRNGFYNHRQHFVEEHGYGISERRSGESDEYDKRSMNDNYEKGLIYYLGEDVVQDYPRAKEYFLKAAIHGHVGAQNCLGNIYREGQGVLQEYSKAVEWYQKAASQGHATAQTNLGFMYQKGYGVAQDYSKAIEWYQKAASQGHAAAQTNLGVMYKNGYGVAQGYSKAIEWYQMAASQGDAAAQNNLGFMYEYGYGVPKDISKAIDL
ncbi:hypothetical protein BGZ79_003370 [Entomortierella chlamydospora]|nr:hypothetical protein BGZ79_003370 [Entomortierella chlamydospora]